MASILVGFVSVKPFLRRQLIAPHSADAEDRSDAPEVAGGRIAGA
jgi:hypothetical protein